MNAYIIDKWCFVPHPGIAGMWVRTQTCVAFVECPQCGAGVGEPCRGAKLNRWIVEAHWPRRDSFKKIDLSETIFTGKLVIGCKPEDKEEKE